MYKCRRVCVLRVTCTFTVRRDVLVCALQCDLSGHVNDQSSRAGCECCVRNTNLSVVWCEKNNWSCHRIDCARRARSGDERTLLAGVESFFSSTKSTTSDTRSERPAPATLHRQRVCSRCVLTQCATRSFDALIAARRHQQIHSRAPNAK